uniref:Uncharacterized protein n=1 Tax=Kalanchoe fedtschenkoi TaxID=63787 RepID=A0A7N0V3S0_KALFE
MQAYQDAERGDRESERHNSGAYAASANVSRQYYHSDIISNLRRLLESNEKHTAEMAVGASAAILLFLLNQEIIVPIGPLSPVGL